MGGTSQTEARAAEYDRRERVRAPSHDVVGGKRVADTRLSVVYGAGSSPLFFRRLAMSTIGMYRAAKTPAKISKP